MANFVHLTPEKNIPSILREGIKAQPVQADFATGVYAMPVVPNFFTSHQWLRELKRGGKRIFWGVYFRLDDNEMVSVGHYNYKHIMMSAAEVIGLLMSAENIQGYEVIIPTGIDRKTIYRTRPLPHILGWRYHPGSHQRRPCGCPVCLRRGEIKSRRIREQWDR